MKSIALKLEGNHLSQKGIFHLTKHCAGWPILTVSLPEECEGLSAYAVFKADTGSTCAVPLIEGVCEVPWETTDAADQEVYVGIYASKAEGVLLALSSNKVTFPVDEGTDPAALTPPKAATPNAFEILREDVDGLELRVITLEKEGVSGTVTDEQVARAVEAYLDENPVVGTPGEDGVDGKSAYEIAVANGFEGDEVTWLESLKGEQGPQGEKGDTGAQGEAGAQGIQGEKGDTGPDGADGVSCTHSWNGTVLTVTSASGTTSADLKGEKGDTGAQGEQGIQGVQGERGEKGETGAQGAAGYTPVKGTDYWTEADKEAIIADVLSALPTAEGVAF